MRDDFDLDAGSFGQRGNLDGGARRKIRRKVFRIDIVHPGKVGKVGEKNRALDHVGKSQLLVLENGFAVLQHAFGLRLDAAGDQIARGRVEGDLAGAKEQVADADAVVVWPTAGADLAGLIIFLE